MALVNWQSGVINPTKISAVKNGKSRKNETKKGMAVMMMTTCKNNGNILQKKTSAPQQLRSSNHLEILWQSSQPSESSGKNMHPQQDNFHLPPRPTTPEDFLLQVLRLCSLLLPWLCKDFQWCVLINEWLQIDHWIGMRKNENVCTRMMQQVNEMALTRPKLPVDCLLPHLAG